MKLIGSELIIFWNDFFGKAGISIFYKRKILCKVAGGASFEARRFNIYHLGKIGETF